MSSDTTVKKTTSTPAPAPKASTPPPKPTQAASARAAEGAPTTKPAPTKPEPVKTADKVTTSDEAQETQERTTQLTNLRKNFSAFDAAGDDDKEKDNKVTSNDVDQIQTLKKDGKLDDYLKEQYADDTQKQLDQRLQETTEAASYLDNGANRRDLDVANGDESDGEISAQDVDKRLTESRDQLPAQDQRETAKDHRDNVRTFNDNFQRFDTANGGDADGNVSREDIQAVAQGQTGASKEARASAQYLLDNPDRLSALDNANDDEPEGEGDNKIGQGDVDESLIAANRDVRVKGRTAEEIKSFDGRVARRQTDGLQDIQKNYNTLAGHDGQISRDDLQSIAGDAHSDKEAQRAAQYLLDNPGRLSNLDGETEGITRDDLKAGKIDAFNELRRNPDAQRTAQIKEQQGQQWETPQDAIRNLRENQDLSTWSEAQLESLNALAQSPKYAKYRDEITAATGNYVNERTNSLDDIPGNQGFQRLLSSQVVSQEDLDSLDPATREIVESAQGNLKGQVQTGLESSLDSNLEGQEGDDEADAALDAFGNDLKALAEKNPALLPYFQEGATTLLNAEETGERINDVKQADDGVFGDVTNWVGGAISDAGGFVGDKLGDVASIAAKWNPVTAPLSLATEGLALAGVDGPKNVLDDVIKGAVDRPIESLVGGVTDTIGGAIKNPTDFAKGIYALTPQKVLADLASGKSISEVANERLDTLKSVGEAFISDYQKTFEEEGTVAGVSHVGSDIATTILTGGASKAGTVTNATGRVTDALSATDKLADGLKTTDKLADGAKSAWKGYSDVTETLGLGTEKLLDGSRLSPWAQDLINGTASNLQSNTLQGAANGKFDLNEEVQRQLANLNNYFQSLAA